MNVVRIVIWGIQLTLSVCYIEAHGGRRHNGPPNGNIAKDVILEPPYNILYPDRGGNHVTMTFLVQKEQPLTINVIQDHCLPIARSDSDHKSHHRPHHHNHHNRHHNHERHHRKRWHKPPPYDPPGNDIANDWNGPRHRPDEKQIQVRSEDYKAKCRTLYENLLPVDANLTTYCKHKENKEITSITIPADQVTGDISNKLTCTIFDNVPDLQVTIEFILKVKAGRRVRVYLNGEKLKFTEINITRNYYDGEFLYRFVEGENITLQCSNIYQIGHVKLEHYNANRELIYSVDELYAKPPLVFQQQMGPSHRASYVDCIYVKDFKEYPQTFVYRTIFLNDFFVLNVNDLNTTQMSRRLENDEYIYIYKYNKGEQLKFTCEKTGSWLEGKIEIKYDKKTRSAQEKVSTEWRKTVVLNTEDLDGGRLFCKLGEYQSPVIQFVMDASRDDNTTVIVICVLIPVVAIIATLCAIYWCRRTRSTNSVQMLNESLSQYSYPRFPSQMTNSDDCDYTYIENEYNYISDAGYMRPNSLYRAKEGSVVPRVRLSTNSNQTDKNNPEIYAKYTAGHNINTANPTPAGSSKYEPTTKIKRYENLHNDNKQQGEMNNVSYSSPQQEHARLNNKPFEKNTNSLKEDNIIRYSNLLKDNNIVQRENDI